MELYAHSECIASPAVGRNEQCIGTGNPGHLHPRRIDGGIDHERRSDCERGSGGRSETRRRVGRNSRFVLRHVDEEASQRQASRLPQAHSTRSQKGKKVSARRQSGRHALTTPGVWRLPPTRIRWRDKPPGGTQVTEDRGVGAPMASAPKACYADRQTKLHILFRRGGVPPLLAAGVERI